MFLVENPFRLSFQSVFPAGAAKLICPAPETGFASGRAKPAADESDFTVTELCQFAHTDSCRFLIVSHNGVDSRTVIMGFQCDVRFAHFRKTFQQRNAVHWRKHYDSVVGVQFPAPVAVKQIEHELFF